jgi:lysophospholipase L1-like esterase
MMIKSLYSFALVVYLIIPLKTCTLVEPEPVIEGQVIDSVRVLALGDSYTIGQSVPIADSWPYQLQDSLATQNIEVLETTIIARTGWTTQALLRALADREFTEKYDLVGLLIGVNNQYFNTGLAGYRTDFEQLVRSAITLADNKAANVFIMSIPDYTVTPVGAQIDDGTVTQEIDAYNKINFQIAQDYGIAYFDVTTLSRMALNKPDLIAKDDLHFSGKMYSQWISLILPHILQTIINS